MERAVPRVFSSRLLLLVGGVGGGGRHCVPIAVVVVLVSVFAKKTIGVLSYWRTAIQGL